MRGWLGSDASPPPGRMIVGALKTPQYIPRQSLFMHVDLWDKRSYKRFQNPLTYIANSIFLRFQTGDTGV